MGALVVYDITKDVSFENVEKWLAELKENATADITMLLVGNKTDLNHMRAVKAEKHAQFADENDMYSFMLSAKTGDNVSSCFYRLAADLAGVVLTKPELEIASKIVRAEIVNHPQHEQDGASADPRERKRAACILQ